MKNEKEIDNNYIKIARPLAIKQKQINQPQIK